MITIRLPVNFQNRISIYKKALFKTLLFPLLFCVSVIPASAEKRAFSSPYSLDRQINDLVDKITPNTDNGIMIMDASTGKLLYQSNAYQHFTPASTTKLFTAAAVLYALHPNYRYHTRVLVDKNSTLTKEFSGNLYFRFSGDPSLTKNNVVALVKKIRDHGIKIIKGNIILDNSRFDNMPYPQGMVMEDAQWGYGSPVTSIIINRNAIPVSISPDTKLQGPVRLTINEDASFFPVTSHTHTITLPQAMKDCAFRISMSPNNAIHAEGCWPVSTTASFKRVAVRNPDQFAIRIIKQTLEKLDMKLNGIITVGDTPKTARTIADHHSKPLSNLVSHMLAFSDNLYANAFLKTLGSEKFKTQGSFFNGLNALKSTLSNVTDIDFSQLVLFDGAGLSSYNLISPMQIGQLLLAVFHSEKIKPTFLDALPEPGENGTLSQRMHAFGLSGNVKAKTGTLSGTTTLAGYIKNMDGKNLIFSIMTNHYVGDTNTLKTLEDQVLSLIHNTKFP